MNRFFKITAVAIAGLAVVAYGISYVWPAYDWDLRLGSPDGQYDLVVLRGNAAAFADFSYNIYLFPHGAAPEDRAKGTRVLYTPLWRSKDHLIYSGYNYPMFRWTGTHSIEIDLTDYYIDNFSLEPVKRFASSDEPIFVSVVFGKENKANTRP
jgi:hypothetical protein